jgi:phytol kinase
VSKPTWRRTARYSATSAYFIDRACRRTITSSLDAGNLAVPHSHSNPLLRTDVGAESSILSSVAAPLQGVAGKTRPTQADPGVARSASWLETLAGRLTPHEWRRRLLHMSPGLLVGLLLLIPHADPLGLPARLILPVVIGATSWFALRSEALYRRRDERGWLSSVISYGVITSALLLIFPGQPEIGMAVTMIIAFGDGSATLVGLVVRGRRLPWNAEKSWAGSLSFILCAIPLATLVYWAEARPGVTLTLACACVAPAALVAALAESLPVRINDNICVGVAAGLTIVLTQTLIVGW